MLRLLLFLVVVAIVAGLLGFTGIAAGAALLAKIIFGLMLAGIVVILVLVMMGVAALF